MAKKRVLTGRRGFLLSLGTLAGMGALANAGRHRHWNNPVQALADQNRSFTVVGNTPLRNRAAAKGLIAKDTNYPIPNGAYYVSPDGKDTNSGIDPASPWSVAKAISSAPASSTIVFRGGFYRNISEKITKKLTLQPYPHEQVWIKGSIEVQGWVASNTVWRKDNWNYSFPWNVTWNDADKFIAQNYPMAGNRDMVFIDGVSLKQVANLNEVIPGTFYVDTAAKRLYIGDNPTGKMVESTALPYAFSISKYGSYDPTGTTVRGLEFMHYANHAISVRAPHVTLENNAFIWNGAVGVEFSSLLSEDPTGPRGDAVVRGNTFSYNGLRGLGGSWANRLLLEDNTISYNNIQCFSQGWDAAGAKFVNSSDMIWRNNLVERNNANGLWVDISSTNATIVKNTVRYNERYGIFFEISHKAIIAGNVVHNNRDGIHISNSSSTRVYNNSTARNVYNIYVDDTTKNNTNASKIAKGITWVSRDHIIKNNISSNPSLNRASVLLQVWNGGAKGTFEPSAQNVTALDYNGYYRPSTSTIPRAIRWMDPGGVGHSYPSVAAFSSATGYSAHALSIDNVSTNPFFVDEANGNFRLKSDSRAIGRGEPLPVDIASALGWTPGVPVDLCRRFKGALRAAVPDL